ncbi:MAG: hypothetical protein RIE24_05870 [Silicimonas sp.]
MTPPDTNIEKQKRRHRPVLIWLAVAIALFVIGSMVYLSSPLGPDPEDDATPEAASE